MNNDPQATSSVETRIFFPVSRSTPALAGPGNAVSLVSIEVENP